MQAEASNGHMHNPGVRYSDVDDFIDHDCSEQHEHEEEPQDEEPQDERPRGKDVSRKQWGGLIGSMTNRRFAGKTPDGRAKEEAIEQELTRFIEDSRAAQMRHENAPGPFSFEGLSAAVECRNLRYDIGRGKSKRILLENINVTVPEASIYGLLGPSGCGKTTLLRLVVGRLIPKSGGVRVFGYKPNQAGSQIPGPAIGYMPQEISVYEDFTIEETLTFFGKVNRMDQYLITSRIEFLVSFLDLPDKRRLIASLSGGQKRRVSLAAALVHSPPLLILDEPTVGVDPLLRQSIWKHLITLAQSERITCIVTTHYIEEARQANVVGLMRHGKLLAEDSPANLLAEHKKATLEDVFLKLCISDSSRKAAQLAVRRLVRSEESVNVDSAAADEDDKESVFTLTHADYEPIGLARGKSPTGQQQVGAQDKQFVVNKHQLRPMDPGEKYPPKPVTAFNWLNTLTAVTWKNYIRLKRNPPVLLFEFVLPAVQLALFCLCFGGDPFDVPVAVVNEESLPLASKFFLDAINKDAIKQVPYDDLAAAIESVRRAETWAAIHIPADYTDNIRSKLANIEEERNVTINIYADMSNLHLALAMENTLREAFLSFTRQTSDLLGYDENIVPIPIRIAEPVYGTLDEKSYLEFMAPGVVISITYVMATGLTALAFILEKRDGLLERSLVSGVTTSHLLLGHAAVQLVVMIMQITLVLCVAFLGFHIPTNGSFFWVVLIVLLQGTAGMNFGLLVSAICSDETAAVMMLVGTFYTNLTLAGIIWPIQAMPRWIRWLSYIQPQTLAIESLRNVLSRGWGITEFGVYLGYLVTITWLIIFLVAAGTIMHYSK